MMLYGEYGIRWGHDEGGKPGQPWNWYALPSGTVITARRHHRGKNYMSLFRVGI